MVWKLRNEFSNDHPYDYTHDLRGNRTEYRRFGYQRDGLDSADFTLSYTYSQTWLDQLTSNDIMVNGTPITQNYVYDGQGNPVSITNFYYVLGTAAQYYHHATLTWDGRQLAKIEIYNASQDLPANLVSTIAYTYSDQGYRTSKSILNSGQQSPTVTNYDLLDSQVIHENNGTDEIYYSYDTDGSLISFNLNGEDYFSITNQLGDIVALVDENRVEVSSFEYDSYGNLLSSTGSIKSPITYRGYRYDWEIGMYYLNSRYYNPESGRFISSDGLLGQTGDILSTNMYAYCSNEPIGHFDPLGNSAASLILNIASTILTIIGLFTPIAVWKLGFSLAIGIALIAISTYDYLSTMSAVEKKFGKNSQRYMSIKRINDFFYACSLISATITVILSCFGLKYMKTITNNALYIFLGVAVARTLTYAGTIYDICMLISTGEVNYVYE